ncbi:MAG: response regulator [Phenylobacterium sp.]|nr:response regulator [Phenylobacterium sp.]
MDDIRDQLLAAFEVEHRDHLQAIRHALETPAKADLKEVFRRAHSLKGAARAVDLPQVEALAHELEALFAEALEGRTKLGGAVLDQIRRLLDVIEAAAAPGSEPDDASGEAVARTHDLVRVGHGAIDQLALAVRELSSAVQAQGALPDRLVRLAREAQSLERDWRTRRRGAPEREFLHRLGTLAQSIGALAAQQGRADWTLQQAAAQLREDVDTLALTPAEAVLGDLGRMIRGMAEDAGIPVDVRISGLDTHAERRVMQALRDPLIHLLRNALSHGAEPVADRVAAGKPDALLIGLDVSSAGGRLLVRVHDDGRGPQPGRILAAAQARDAAPPGLSEATASPEEILALAFEPGVSAAETVDELSGRGMGLSVVAETVRALGGSVMLSPGTPHGTEVRLSAPISTARQLLVLVESSGDIFAIPAYAVRRTLRIPSADVEVVEDVPTVRIEIHDSHVVAPMITLDALLGRPAPPPGPFVHALLISRADRHLALVVDAVHEVSEFVLESVRPGGVDSALVTGAVRLHDAPAAVLNPETLFEQWLRNARRLAASGLGIATITPAGFDRVRTILVVDDSITTRTLEKSILESQGYRVRLAVDGVDALQVLRSGEALIDLVVADIEMPRMDGFSLVQAIKADGALAELPVILMTSRDDPDDIQRGMDLGADAYLTKQKFDQRELLASIGRLL